MPEPLKNLYTKEKIKSVASQLNKIYNKFEMNSFMDDIFNSKWNKFELKERMRHITHALIKYLPDNFKESSVIVDKTAIHFKGFEFMFFPEFIELKGLKHFKSSMQILENITEYSSAEFAVRPFIKKYQDKTMKTLLKWSSHKNEHVRRLASEGCRPRLPWAMALPEFKKDPSPILPILENLKNDKSEYVRRSVANNLNDISKDNPCFTIDISRSWINKCNNTDWIVKHGCRTLLKQGNLDVLLLFGYSESKDLKIKKLTYSKNVKLGDYLFFDFEIVSIRKLGLLRLEYAIYFKKKNGKLSKKVFKISEMKVNDNIKKVAKKHSFKIITTRVYYLGEHQLSIIANGKEFKPVSFKLIS